MTSAEALKQQLEDTALVHMDALYRTALRMMGNPDDAKDLM